uniref:CG-1 domain-containing protein n=1 Tax=Poecilia reticulata TaxID=8081 RepID=A0A3P9NSX3_POERE
MSATVYCSGSWRTPASCLPGSNDGSLKDHCLLRMLLLPPGKNSNEIASYLISFDRHDEWLCCSLKTRPKNGSIILYNRKKVKYRKDGYCWKKRKDGKTTREDHMKLKVQGMESHRNRVVEVYQCFSAVPVPLRLLRPFLHRANIPQTMLLAAAGQRHTEYRLTPSQGQTQRGSTSWEGRPPPRM